MSWMNLTKGWLLDGYTEGVDSEASKNRPSFYSLSYLDFLRLADRPCLALVHVHTVGHERNETSSEQHSGSQNHSPSFSMESAREQFRRNH